jgi:hypothetical protein
MTTIVTRITNPTGGTAKGSPLTSVEIDQNFINLNDNKLESSQLNTNTAAASFTTLGVGTASSGNTGEIRATNQITSFYSDERLKTKIQVIPNALEKVMELRGITYNANELAESFGFINKEKQVGVIASDVEKVLPEAVKPAPFDIMIFEDTEISRSGENYKTVQYEKLVPLLIEAIKELNIEMKQLKGIK